MYKAAGKPIRVVITDFCPGYPCIPGPAHLDLRGTALGAMAVPGKEQKLRDAGVLEIRYARVACDYSGTNIVFRVETGSNTQYFAVLVEFQEGDGDLAGVALKLSSGKNGGDEWWKMKQSWGAIWMLNAGSVLHPPFSAIKLTSQYSQYSGQNLIARNVIPTGWKPDVSYGSLVNYL